MGGGTLSWGDLDKSGEFDLERMDFCAGGMILNMRGMDVAPIMVFHQALRNPKFLISYGLIELTEM